ncbi:MAG: hypothetical protein RLZZ584_1135 [Pseudomonadota bacterium]|jgi:hypothetical protein
MKDWTSRFFTLAFAVLIGTGLPWSAQAAAGHSGDRQEQRNDDQRGQRAGVLPADAKPHGYSLADMARLTAAFNVSDRLGPQPNTPIQMLFESTNQNGTFHVRENTYLYLPIAFSDNSAPILGNFPRNVLNQRAVKHYWFSQREIGTTLTSVTIDGKTYKLGARHVAGAIFTDPLPTTGTQYLVAAAFIAPLPVGVHTITAHFMATGDALRLPPFDEFFPDGFFEANLEYTVIVD